VAADYIYSLKRHYDPQLKSGNLYILENAKILGLSELRRELMKAKKPFDYDREVEGLKADWTATPCRSSWASATPRFVYKFSDAGAFTGAVAREVDRVLWRQDHGASGRHQCAFAFADWRRSSRIVLEKNPNFRDKRYAETVPPEADPPCQGRRPPQLQGRKLPMVDRVVVEIIEEAQPRWLSFLRK
jgi:ABC-type transport system substrate-binding protein